MATTDAYGAARLPQLSLVSRAMREMERFRRSCFLGVEGGERSVLCRDLSSELSSQLRHAVDFHGSVYLLVRALKGLGHDLCSFDESDEHQAWCPDYQNTPCRGLVVTFTPSEVIVDWAEE